MGVTARLPGATFFSVRLVALTGGIGSGKSSVSERLAAKGAVIVDADEVVKDLQKPGRAVFVAMVERWGDKIVADSGTLDRAEVAGIVFGDKAELDALNAMVHPAVKTEMRIQTEPHASSDAVVVLDIPLLVEGGDDRRGASGVIVVDCEPEVAIERLIEFRNFSREDGAARIAAQASREDRLAAADFVIDNGGDLAQLEAEVERCWEWLEAMDPTPWPPPKRPRAAVTDPG